MNKLNLILILTIVLMQCSPQGERTFKSYGEKIETLVARPLEVLETNMHGDSVAITLSGVIDKTCSKKGCWMNVKDAEGRTIRVTFKDYGFFVPAEGVEGREVVFAGIAKRKVTDVETLRHFAEDAGKPAEEIEAITEPVEEVTFVASGVVIYNNRR